MTPEDNVRTLQLFRPRPSQRLVLESTAENLIVDCGRQWGKTILGANWLQEYSWTHTRFPAWWVAPTYAQSKMVYRRVIHANANNGAIKDKSDSELRIAWISGGVMAFKTADNPENLRGESVGQGVMDEAARCKRETWEDVLSPALAVTGGRFMFISTPKGRNWFYELWTRGQDRQANPKFESWKFPSSDNPLITAEHIEHARQTLPQAIFDQEYLAEFLEDSSGVFRGVSACVNPMLEREAPVKGRIYYAGLDLAKHVDFTVLTILDEQGRQVYWNRFQKVNWPYQKQLVTEVCQQYDARLLMDSTGVGDPIFDDLLNAGLDVTGYKFTNDSKKKLVESLMIAFEQGKIQIIEEPIQLNELQIFEYEINPSGTISYNAPEGYHDDCVMGLALANFAYQSGARYSGWGIGRV
jgi:phage FluMu gp28-like protein